jgi:probable rRNA maturation factor
MVTIDTKLTDISEQALDRFLRRARRAADLRGQVHVLIVANRRMKTLNWQFRGKNQPTDVLSFPAIAEVAHEFAGDIVISADIATANARDLGHPVAHELKVLILHGVLHLSGHDHEMDNGEMARKESRLRKELGLKDGLIERHSGITKQDSRRLTRKSELRTRTSRGRA